MASDGDILLGLMGEVIEVFTDPVTGYEFEHLMRPSESTQDDAIYHTKNQLPGLEDETRHLCFYVSVRKSGFDPVRIEITRAMGVHLILAQYKDWADQWLGDQLEKGKVT